MPVVVPAVDEVPENVLELLVDLLALCSELLEFVPAFVVAGRDFRGTIERLRLEAGELQKRAPEPTGGP